MASAYLIEALNAAGQIAEARSRRYERGSMSPLPVEPDKQATMDRVLAAQLFAHTHTDRQVAAEFPDVVERAVSPGRWRRLKPRDEVRR